MSVHLLDTARATLAAAIAADATAVTVETGQGARFPALGSGDWFPLVLESAAGECEICRAIARTGDVLTVQRGQEDTTPRAFAAGDRAELRLTVAALDAFFRETSAELESPGAAIEPETNVLLTNLALSRLAGDIDIGATEIALASGTGDKFPSPDADNKEWFPLVFEDAYGRIEICHAFWRSGDRVRVRRAQEGTQPRAYGKGDAAELRLTVAALMAYRPDAPPPEPLPKIFIWRVGDDAYGQMALVEEETAFGYFIWNGLEEQDGYFQEADAFIDADFDSQVLGVNGYLKLPFMWIGHYGLPVSPTLSVLSDYFDWDAPIYSAALPYPVGPAADAVFDDAVTRLNAQFAIAAEVVRHQWDAPDVSVVVPTVPAIFCRARDLCSLVRHYLLPQDFRIFIVLNETPKNRTATRFSNALMPIRDVGDVTGNSRAHGPKLRPLQGGSSPISWVLDDIDNDMSFKGIWMNAPPSAFGLPVGDFNYFYYVRMRIVEKATGNAVSDAIYIRITENTDPPNTTSDYRVCDDGGVG